MIVVDPYNVSRLVDMQDAISKGLVHLHIVGPRGLFRATVVRFMLSVVEKSIELVLRVLPPSPLVFEYITVIFTLDVRQPNRQSPAAGVMMQDLFEAISVRTRHANMVRM